MLLSGLMTRAEGESYEKEVGPGVIISKYLKDCPRKARSRSFSGKYVDQWVKLRGGKFCLNREVAL